MCECCYSNSFCKEIYILFNISRLQCQVQLCKSFPLWESLQLSPLFFLILFTLREKKETLVNERLFIAAIMYAITNSQMFHDTEMV